MFSKRFNERVFPTPGTPVIPIRTDLNKQALITALALTK
jgi:hypothetical protein